MNRGVFGAPFYITEDDQRFWGQDRLDDLQARGETETPSALARLIDTILAAPPDKPTA